MEISFRNALMEYLSAFKTYLQSRSYRSNTIRNYLSDVNKFISLTSTASSSSSPHSLLTSNAISLFLSKTSADTNSKRYIAALRCFCQFALDQNLISINPFHQLPLSTTTKDAQIDLDQLIKQYQSYLSSKNKTSATIKNYINDLQNFINWANSFET